MKKLFAMLLVVVALGGFTIGCGESSAPAPSGGASAAPSEPDAGADTATEGSGEKEAPSEG